MLIVLLTNRKDYELFLSDVVFAFDGLEKFGFAGGGLISESWLVDGES